ncbi:GbpC/Spa domain-containing protein [Streptococcus dentasini]
MTSKKRTSYTLFSSLLLATVLAANSALADDITANDQANQPSAVQEQSGANQATDQAATADNQTILSEGGSEAPTDSEVAVPDPTVTEVSRVENSNGTIQVTSEVTSNDLEEAKSAVTTFNQDNNLTGDQVARLQETQTQTQPSIDAAHADNQRQAQAIQLALQDQKQKLDNYKAAFEKYQRDLAAKPELDKVYQEALAAYQVEKKEYDAKLKAWQEYQEQVKNGTAAGRVETAQGLVYQSEPGAIISLEGVTDYITKEGMREVTSNSDVLQHYNTDNYGPDKLTTENPYSGSEDTWFKMKVGDTVTATYSDLTKSSYGEKQIKKVTITYRLNSSTSADGSAIVELYHDPTKTIFIGAQVPEGGEKDPVSVTMQIRFFDQDDNEIDMSDNKAIMSLSSLNHWTSDLGDHIEKVSVGANEFIKIPGSSVDLHGEYIYAEQQNQRKSQGATFDAEGADGWDAINADGTPRSVTAFYGAGAMTYKGKEFTFTASGNNPYIPTTIWFSTNSVVAVPENPGDAPLPPEPAEDPHKPEEPAPLTLVWHKNLVEDLQVVPPTVPKTPLTISVEVSKPKDPDPEKPLPQAPNSPIPVQLAEPESASPIDPQTPLPKTGDSRGYGIVAFGVGVICYAVLTLLGSSKIDKNED